MQDRNLPDFQKAFSWYKKAADKEDPAGMASLGFFYEMGIVVEKDEKKAFSLYKRAAEKGVPLGQARLGLAYYEGMGTQKNNDLALYWMGKATENGDEEAVELLATLKELIAYEKQYGVQQPYVTNGNTITIIMDKRNSIYYVPCKINGEKADFVFDTGAGLISLSSDFAERLKNLGLLTDEDFLGYGTSMIADGSTHDVLVVNIRDVEIGGLHLYNVRASIKDQQNAPLLLGQSAIEKLGKVTIDGHKLIIHKD
jgi:clan AA aspartic protease (TIGR02281 family)